MKKLIAFLMMIAVCMSLLIFPALADDDYPEVGFDFEAFEAQEKIDGQPNRARWKYTSSTSQDLEIYKKEATAAANVTGYRDKATKIVIYMYIQQLKDGKWHTIDYHRYSFDNWHASKEITYSPCPHGYTYRLKCSYYVYSNGYYDNIDATTANFVYN